MLAGLIRSTGTTKRRLAIFLITSSNIWNELPKQNTRSAIWPFSSAGLISRRRRLKPKSDSSIVAVSSKFFTVVLWAVTRHVLTIAKFYEILKWDTTSWCKSLVLHQLSPGSWIRSVTQVELLICFLRSALRQCFSLAWIHRSRGIGSLSVTLSLFGSPASMNPKTKLSSKNLKSLLTYFSIITTLPNLLKGNMWWIINRIPAMTSKSDNGLLSLSSTPTRTELVTFWFSGGTTSLTVMLPSRWIMPEKL